MRLILVLSLLLSGCATIGEPTVCVKGKKVTITMYTDFPGRKPPCKSKEVIKKVREYLK